MRRSFRILGVVVGSVGVLLLLAGLAAVVVLRSPWFHEKLRQRVVYELERATGGESSIGKITWDFSRLNVRVEDLVLHGTEPRDGPPLLEVKSVDAGLRLLSFWKKQVDLASLIVNRPRINLIIAPDGSTNFPKPKVRRTGGKSAMETVLDLAAAHFEVKDGEIQFAAEKTSISARGENLRAQFAYDFLGPRYVGRLTIDPLVFRTRKTEPITLAVDLNLTLRKNRIDFAGARLTAGPSQIDASGAIEQFVPFRSSFDFTARLAVNQVAKLTRIPQLERGAIELTGNARYANPADYAVSGRMTARNLDYRQGEYRVSGVNAISSLSWTPGGIELQGLRAALLGGHFSGRAIVRDYERFDVDGVIEDVTLSRVFDLLDKQFPKTQPRAWSGLVSGPVQLRGRFVGKDLTASGQVRIAPAEGAVPVGGYVDATYNRREETLSLGTSRISTPATKVQVSGVLGARIQITASTTDLNDLLPAINIFSNTLVSELPVSLRNGSASFQGTLTGKLNAPEIAGHVEAASFLLSGAHMDKLSAEIAINESGLQVRNASVLVGTAQVQTSSVSLALTNW
ncbi:MAG: hypothetical protein ABIZ80_10175, partial [Bryobacteraceae bacterium]